MLLAQKYNVSLIYKIKIKKQLEREINILKARKATNKYNIKLWNERGGRRDGEMKEEYDDDDRSV